MLIEHEDKKIKLTPYRPVAKNSKPNALKKSKRVNLISVIEFDELKNGAPCMIPAAREVVKTPDNTSSESHPVIEELSDVFPETF